MWKIILKISHIPPRNWRMNNVYKKYGLQKYITYKIRRKWHSEDNMGKK